MIILNNFAFSNKFVFTFINKKGWNIFSISNDYVLYRFSDIAGYCDKFLKTFLTNFAYISLHFFFRFVMVSTIVGKQSSLPEEFPIFSLFFQVNQDTWANPEMSLPSSDWKTFNCKSSLAFKMWVVVYLPIWDNKNLSLLTTKWLLHCYLQ